MVKRLPIHVLVLGHLMMGGLLGIAAGWQIAGMVVQSSQAFTDIVVVTAAFASMTAVGAAISGFLLLQIERA